MESSRCFDLVLVFWFFVFLLVLGVRSDDSEALLRLKSAIDPANSLPWAAGTNVCQWRGVKACLNGRISKLIVENLNLTGSLDPKGLNTMDQLRVLSFKGNSISGPIPDLSGLVNLKILYLNKNNFSGYFPTTLASLHRLKIIVLAENLISGRIPPSLLDLPRLYTLYLENNRFTGPIPPLNQTSLEYLNVSNNKLSGPIPATPALSRIDTSSFFGNLGLCGDQIRKPCTPELAPASLPPETSQPSPESSNRGRLIGIIAGSIGGFLLILLAALLICLACSRRRGRIKSKAGEARGKSVVEGEEGGGVGAGAGGGESKGGFSWERGDGALGSLVFLSAGDRDRTTYTYTMEDLLKASAETLGRGTMGSTYKAVMESGFIVTVKRLKDARYPRMEEFRRHVEILGKLRHPNLVPLRAYFQAKEERLLVYDYFPNGSLSSLIHGTKSSGAGKPLHWTSCLKIAEDLATGLLYIHQNPGLTHGNLKSSNVLLGSDFESCLTDYGLSILRDPDSLEETSATSLLYRAPECRDPRKAMTQPADVYSFGVLLLELLTGRTPNQDLVQEQGVDISRWVASVRDEETESGDEPASGNEGSEEKLQALLNIATACVVVAPGDRPVMREVLKMIRDARAETHISSNSSDHSPGRWSDTVQSLPREEHLSI